MNEMHAVPMLEERIQRVNQIALQTDERIASAALLQLDIDDSPSDFVLLLAGGVS